MNKGPKYFRMTVQFTPHQVDLLEDRLRGDETAEGLRLRASIAAFRERWGIEYKGGQS